MATNIDTFKHFGIALLIILLVSSIRSVEHVFSSFGYYIVVLYLSWKVAKLYRKYDSNIVEADPEDKAVLITGCDSGFGNKLAEKLDAKGFTVFASCLDPEGKGAQHLLTVCSKQLKVFKLDVTKDEDVREAVSFVKSNLMANKLWALVNNAGIAQFLPIEWGQEGVDSLQKQMEVNVVGAVRVTKAFLPLLRKTKESRIINMGTLAGRLAFPGVSSYSMSKFSLRAFNDCLRNEVKQFDINVILIEPTVYSTDLTNYDLWIDDFQTKWKETPEEVRRAYGAEKCDILHERINSVMYTAKENPQDVIDALVDAISSSSPESYYYVYRPLERVLMTVLEWLSPEIYDLGIDERMYFPLTRLLRNKYRI